MRALLFVFLLFPFLSGCDLIRDSFTYKEKTEDFINTLLDENYEQCLKMFAMDHQMAAGSDTVQMKEDFARLRQMILDNFGSHLDFSFMRSEKTWSTHDEMRTLPNTTLAFVQFSSDTHFGALRLLMDDHSKKFLKIHVMDVREPIPDMTTFWFVGIIVILVLAFNIYVLTLIRKSDFKNKWVKYLSVIILNVPTISYSLTGGLGFEILSFQFLLGISFNFMGYMNTSWAIGIPLGGIYWFWKIRSREEGEQQMQALDDNEPPEQSMTVKGSDEPDRLADETQ